MTDLDQKEQEHVRMALRYLYRNLGGWAALSKVLGFTPATLKQATCLRGRSISASMALRVARFLDASVDDLLAGRYKPGACSKCGHLPSYLPALVSDFVDESTVVEDAPRPAIGEGLRVVQ